MMSDLTKTLAGAAALAALDRIRKIKIRAENLLGSVDNYPALIRSCFSDRSLEGLNRLWQAWEQLADDSPQSGLVWLKKRAFGTDRLL